MTMGMKLDSRVNRGMSRITVFLADWQVLFREGIHFTLSGEEDIDVIGETTGSEEALTEIQANPPRVAVMNADHDDFAGVRATRYIRQNIPSVAVLLTIDNTSEEHVFQTMKSGANACITKDTDPADLIDIIRMVAQGRQPIADMMLIPGIATRVLKEFEQFGTMSEQVNNLLPGLTGIETDILRSIVQAGSADQVTRAINMSIDEIGEHLKRILAKLVSNDYIRQVMAAAQDNRLSGISQSRSNGKSAEEFITRDEFAAFKDTIWERFRSAIDEIK